VQFELGKPYQPYQQLLSVLPRLSKDCLPKDFHPLMDEDSLIADFYPNDCFVDLKGKRFA